MPFIFVDALFFVVQALSVFVRDRAVGCKHNVVFMEGVDIFAAVC